MRSSPRQHDLRKPVLQEAGFLGVTDVGLRAGVELDRRQVETSRPMSWTISASAPASCIWRIRRSALATSSSWRMVLQVTNTRAKR